MQGYSIPDLQIESYPGANFHHAHAIPSKASSHTTVGKVVLSFGINPEVKRPRKQPSNKCKQHSEWQNGRFRTLKFGYPLSTIPLPYRMLNKSLSVGLMHTCRKICLSFPPYKTATFTQKVITCSGQKEHGQCLTIGSQI